MKRYLLTITLSVMSVSCGSLLPENNRQTEDPNVPTETVEQVINLGEVHKAPPVEYKLQVDGHMTDSGRFHYDQDTNTSLLSLAIVHRTNLEKPYNGRPLKFESKEASLYTTVDINSLGNHYDTSEAPIYLKVGTQEIQVGQFRPVVEGMTKDQKLESYLTPVFCTDHFIDVCQLKAQVVGDGDGASAVVTIVLETGGQVKVLSSLYGYYSRDYSL
tara:strand:+ start:416 stop:1063 length:648 start_codon:yes stop_codon:yes gene_type:complete